MSDIKAIRDYLATYQKLETGRPLWVEYLTENTNNYTVFLVPGKSIEVDITGNKTVEYPFAFGAQESAVNEQATLRTAEFYEAFAEWLDEQTEAGNLPVLDAGKTATSIEALDTATILERAQDTGVYQILCKLTYEMKGKII